MSAAAADKKDFSVLANSDSQKQRQRKLISLGCCVLRSVFSRIKSLLPNSHISCVLCGQRHWLACHAGRCLTTCNLRSLTGVVMFEVCCSVD